MKLWLISFLLALAAPAQVRYSGLPIFPFVTDNSNTTCSSSNLPSASSPLYTNGFIFVVNTGASVVVGCRSNGTSWIATTSTGGVASVTGTAPVASSCPGGICTVSMPAATNSQNGYLTSANFSNFNGKLGDPGSNGVVKRTGAGTTVPAVSADILTLFGGCTGVLYMGADGNCHTIASGLGASGVTPGSYTNANVTVAPNGLVTAASNGSGSGGGYATIQVNATPLHQRPTVNLIPGTGINQVCADNAVANRTDCTPSVNTSTVPTIGAAQAGLSICNSATGNTAFTCSFNYSGSAKLTAYSSNMMIFLITDTSTTTTATLNIDTVGNVTLKQKDCSTDIGSNITAGQPGLFFYNGTVFCEIHLP